MAVRCCEVAVRWPHFTVEGERPGAALVHIKHRHVDMARHVFGKGARAKALAPTALQTDGCLCRPMGAALQTGGCLRRPMRAVLQTGDCLCRQRAVLQAEGAAFAD